ncbi:uncharacterized protein TEOVI_000858700 [Trypanosoma equiperdum]|uniref:Uncharacterized protein n=1 Tax=Trypanosoma equiperdum TaxID=5694 RepID=A0A1G4I775_TRYEQ|nr:hypothetical protein, conserved [Trypanosoma equiperdum]
MPSESLADVDCKINEMRDRLMNISQCLQRDEEFDAGFVPGRSPEVYQQDERNSIVSHAADEELPRKRQTSISSSAERIFTKEEKLSVLREEAGDGNIKTLNTSRRKGSTTALVEEVEMCDSGIKEQESIKTTYQLGAPYTKNNNINGGPPQAGVLQAERQVHVSSSQPLTHLVGGSFDPLQAMEIRLREKLRKKVSSSNHPSDTVGSVNNLPVEQRNISNSAAENSPLHEPWTATAETPSNKTQGPVRESSEKQYKQYVDKGCGSCALDTECLCAGEDKRPTVRSSSVVTEVSRPLVSRGSCQHRVQGTNFMRPIFARAPHSPGSPRVTEKSVSCKNTIRGNSGPRGRTPSQVGGDPVRPVLPRKTAPQRTVLDILTGAELFALLRLRGVIVSRGDTGEYLLPEARCHSVYLSPEEHRQLLDLRTKLRAQCSRNPVEPRIRGSPMQQRAESGPTRRTGQMHRTSELQCNLRQR